MKKSLLMTVIITCIISYSANAQAEIANAEFQKTTTGLVVVKYDIANSSTVQPFYVELKYFDSRFRAIEPKNVSGDINRVTGGEGKKILWNYTKDGLNSGQPISCELTLFKSNQAGFGSHFLSTTMFPGLGSYKITNRKSHLLHGLIGYGMLAGSAYLSYKIHKDNRDYKRNPTTEKFYSLRREKRIGNLMWIISAQMWINGYIDLLYQSKKTVKGLPIMKISGRVE